MAPPNDRFPNGERCEWSSWSLWYWGPLLLLGGEAPSGLVGTSADLSTEKTCAEFPRPVVTSARLKSSVLPSAALGTTQHSPATKSVMVSSFATSASRPS